MDTLGAIALIVGAYLLGAVPWGVVLGRTIKGIDPRQHGSGATGATNSFRLLGAPIAISVFILDFAKGLAPVILARSLEMPDWTIALCAIVPAIGHCWSPYIGFKGGKGMATGGGSACGLFPWLALLLLPMILVVYLTRYVSLASLAAAIIGASLVVSLAVVSDFPGWWAFAVTMISALIIYHHRANIRRLMDGTENKFGARVSV
ncbi:MAG: glycerol-3-phosphate 1-O-acyltransferase PlsY [Thermomicrobiales bacterium]